MAIKKVLVVCIGNGDRSPVMAAILAMLLKNAGHDVVVESAGIEAKEGTAPPFAVTACKRMGLDISGHKKRRTDSLVLGSYDLILCASDEIAGKVLEQGAEMHQLYNIQIANPWPVKFQEDYDLTVMAMLGTAYRVISHFFPAAA